MKPFFPAVIALVVGIVLGAFQPRGELLALRAELDELRSDRGKPCKGGAADGIRSILRADAPSLERPRVRNVSPAEGAEPPTPPEEPSPAEAPPAATADAPSQTPEESLAAMRAALDARRTQAMAALVEQADLDEDEQSAVNAAMDEMNRELKTEVEAFVADAVSRGEFDRRDMMDFAAEALDIVIAADDEMRAVVPRDVYADLDDSAVDPFSYVSGDTLDAIVRLQDVRPPDFE